MNSRRHVIIGAAQSPYLGDADVPHDQLWKQLLWAFFEDFMTLFFEDVARQLDFSRTEQLDKEQFTDLPEGSRREMDIVAKVHTREGTPELILVHVEVSPVK
ncbi:MAG: hypothetical protein FJX72_18335 [Armatimonadetes bacterium]|nr:hypothetical protein [Armatimonadota bacterium]